MTFKLYFYGLSVDHDTKVTEIYLTCENLLSSEETFWDEVLREHEYFENYQSPVDDPERKGNCVGEADVLLLNYEDQVGLYHEVKPHRGDFAYADEQIERMDQFFDGWDIYGQKHVYER